MMTRAVCDDRMDQAIPFADSGHRRTSRHMLSFLACSPGQIPASVQTPQLKNQPRTIFKYVSPHLFIYPHYFDHIYAGFFSPSWTSWCTGSVIIWLFMAEGLRST